nr:hypothetical protein [Tanacetum cinerariifolium]
YHKAVVAKIGTSSSTLAISSDVAELKDMVKALLLDKKNQSPAPTPSTTPALVKAVEPNCLGDMSHHKDIYDNPSLTKKVFANMKRVGTSFYGVVTLLFDNMFVLAAKEVGLIQDDVQLITIPTEPSTSKPYKKHKPKKQQTQAPKVPYPKPSPEHRLPLPSNDPLPGGKDSLKLKELMDLCTHLSNKVLELESEVIDIKSTYKERIEKLEGRVDRLDEENMVLKELHSVYSKDNTAAPVVEKEKSFKQERIITNIDEDFEINLKEAQAKLYRMDLEHPKKGSIKDKGKGILIEEPKSLKGQAQIEQDEALAKQLEAELNANINWNAVIEQVKRSERLNDAVMKYQALKRKPLTEAQARKNMIIYLKNMAGYKMNYFKGMTYSEIRPLSEKHYKYNQAILEEVNEEVTVPKKEVKVEGHKREGESLEKEITKKQKMDEEAEELKSHLQIVSNDDDDAYTEATPLASKFLFFSILLKNFDKEDLKSLWKLVKERFKKTEPKNYTDNYLLKTLKIMFEQPDVEASVWRDQKGKYGLAKRYPLTHFTLEQMLNTVRLEVEEESEMSLELLRLVRRQLNEGLKVDEVSEMSLELLSNKVSASKEIQSIQTTRFKQLMLLVLNAVTTAKTSNTLHNAIMEAGGKDRPPMLAPSNCIQWKSRIKRYIDTRPNHEIIHYCLKNPLYKYTWADKVVPVSEGSPETTTKRSQQDATRNRGKAIVNSSPPIYDQEPSMVAEDDEMSKDNEIDKLMVL